MKNTLEQALINACKYGYDFHKTSSFPEQEFEQAAINNFRQDLQGLPEKYKIDIDFISNEEIDQLTGLIERVNRCRKLLQEKDNGEWNMLNTEKITALVEKWKNLLYVKTPSDDFILTEGIKRCSNEMGYEVFPMNRKWFVKGAKWMRDLLKKSCDIKTVVELDKALDYERKNTYNASVENAKLIGILTDCREKISEAKDSLYRGIDEFAVKEREFLKTIDSQNLTIEELKKIIETNKNV